MLAIDKVRTSTIDTASGNLTLNPAGTTIDLSSKNLTNVGSINGSTSTAFLVNSGAAPSANQLLAFTGTASQVTRRTATLDSSNNLAGINNLDAAGNVSISGNLAVHGSVTYVDSENTRVSDGFIELNAGYTGSSATAGGIVVDQKSVSVAFTATIPAGATFTPGVLATSAPTVNVTFAGTVTPGQIVQIQGTTNNDGLYEVQSSTAGLMTMRGIGGTANATAFCITNFIAETTSVPATITAMSVSSLGAGLTGRWASTSGSAGDAMAYYDLLSYADQTNPASTFILTSTAGNTRDIARTPATVDVSGNTTLPSAAALAIGSDTRFRRTTTKTVTFDDGASGAAAFIVTGAVTTTQVTFSTGGSTITDDASNMTLTPGGSRQLVLQSTGNINAVTSGNVDLQPTGTVKVNSRPINLGGNDTFIRRSAANTVMFDRDGAGTGAINVTLNGGTLTANLTGNVTGNVTGTVTTTSINFGNSVFLRSTGTGTALFDRDGAGTGSVNLSLNGGTLTANLTGNVTGNITGTLSTTTAVSLGNTTFMRSTGTGAVMFDRDGAGTGSVNISLNGGTLTGNVTGNLTGNVTGNLTGSVTGGTVSGTFSTVAAMSFGNSVFLRNTGTGTAMFDRDGAGTGSVNLSLNGGSLIGNVTGNLTGNVTGDVTGGTLSGTDFTIVDVVMSSIGTKHLYIDDGTGSSVDVTIEGDLDATTFSANNNSSSGPAPMRTVYTDVAPAGGKGYAHYSATANVPANPSIWIGNRGNDGLIAIGNSTTTDTYIRRTTTATLELSQNGSGTGAVTLLTTGGTVSAATLTSTAALSITTASNGNVTITPNGTGIITMGKNVTFPSTGTLTFGTTGNILNNVNGAFQFRTNANTISGTAIAVDTIYANTFIAQVSGQTVMTLISGGISLPGGKILTINASTSGYVEIAIPSTTTSYTFTLPSSVGTANSVLTTNGSGASSWDSRAMNPFARTSSGAVATTWNVGWTKLSEKTRLVWWESLSFTATSTNPINITLDTTTAFGSPLSANNCWMGVVAGGTPLGTGFMSVNNFGGGNIILVPSPSPNASGGSGNWTNAVAYNVLGGSMVVAIN